MEPFLDPLNRAPVTQILIREGQTRVIAIKKPKLGPPDGVIVASLNSNIAFCHQVARLRKSKSAYDGEYDLLKVAQDTLPVQVGDNIYFQISGRSGGTTSIEARLRDKPGGDRYAQSIPTTVVPAAHNLPLGASFDALW